LGKGGSRPLAATAGRLLQGTGATVPDYGESPGVFRYPAHHPDNQRIKIIDIRNLLFIFKI